MIRPSPALEVISLLFHDPSPESWLASARNHDVRLELASTVIDTVEAGSERTFVVMPAGVFRAPTDQSRDDLANELLELSARREIAIAFGIDVGRDDAWGPTEGPPKSYGFLCDAGEALLWPIELVRHEKSRRRRSKERRTALVDCRRVSMLIDGEIFSEKLRARLEREEPELIVVLAHMGPNERWQPRLEELRRIAPVFVTGELPDDDEPSFAHGTRGWIIDRLVSTASVSVYRHRQVAIDDAFARELDRTIDEADVERVKS